MPWTIVDSFGDSEAFWIYEIPRQAVGWCDYGILRRKQGDSILILLERAGRMRLRLWPEGCSTSRDKSSSQSCLEPPSSKVRWKHRCCQDFYLLTLGMVLPSSRCHYEASMETVFHVLEAGYPAAFSDRMQPNPKTLET